MSCAKIEIRRLTVDLTGPSPRRLIEDLSLTVEGGRALAVVGESGAGKSMTALAVMDLLPAGIRRTGGDVFFGERNVGGMTGEERRRFRNREVSMILQNPMSAFNPVISIGGHFQETVASHFPEMSASAIRRRAAGALLEAGFPEPDAVLDIYPFQMSGGMLQRVMIALALTGDPSFVIADEATTDLDVVAQKRILSVLRERCRERHIGLLVITHDLGVAAWLADDVLVMRHGRLVEKGPLREVFESPKEDYTRTILRAHRALHGERFAGLMHRLELA